MQLTRRLLLLILVVLSYWSVLAPRTHADDFWQLTPAVQAKCLRVLKEGMHGEEFWPGIHAAEALTLAGQGNEVRNYFEPKLATETDDQRRCGLARELVRAGDRDQCAVMLAILRKADTHGHVHAAESLYKVGWIGDSTPLEKAFSQTKNVPLRIMAAAALAKHGQGAVKQKSYSFLRDSLRDESDPTAFRLCAWVLGRIGNDSDRTLIRSRLVDADDDLVHAFLEYALAALGDEQSKKAVLSYLDSDDAALRTYAAVFAGEADLIESAPLLVVQLDDENIDARIRAAQALIVLAP